MTKAYENITKLLRQSSDDILQLHIYKELEGVHKAVVILRDGLPQNIESFLPLARYCTRHRLSLPLIVSKDFVLNSLDSYPLEFLNIVSAEGLSVIDKEDVLGNLVFDKGDLRLQMEREFRSKWILTRQLALGTQLKPRLIRAALRQSILSLVPAFKGFFYLKDMPYPKSLKELFEQAALICQLDLGALDIWLNSKSINTDDLNRYLSLLDKLISYMDEYQVL